jgi:exonuclease III
MDSTPSIDLISWNVRGLNQQARRDAVHQLLAATTCNIACLQESKLSQVCQHDAAYLGGYRLRNFAYKPASGPSHTRGGIIVLWNDMRVASTNVSIGEYHLTMQVQLLEFDTNFLLTVVYGPSRRADKPAFLREIKSLKPQAGTRWLITGDFNLIYRAADKNNSRLSHRLMRQFREALDESDLSEISLQNRKFTWSNERERPTMARLDRFFCNAEWDATFSSHVLNALSTSHSDHCPLLLSSQSGPRRPRSFKFENFWIHLPGFKETVKEAWDAPMNHHEPFHILYHKLRTTAEKLRTWSKDKISDAKKLFFMAQEVILRLDIAQENRDLSTEEMNLRSRLKKRLMGLAVVERARCRQASRLTLIKLGDANTKFFHRRINARRRKNHIQRLKHGQGWAVNHDDKAILVHEHFSQFMGRPTPRQHDLNWDALLLPQHDLSSLDVDFTEEEIKAAIHQMPADKAPGPDGFTGIFFKSCWEIIKADFIRAANAFHALRSQSLPIVNTANVILIPKKEGAECITDYRPISLIHSFAKIMAKVLATRLAPHMSSIVSASQSAFIKKRSIHDNYMAVHNAINRYRRSKQPALFLKLDITKAFDSVRWEYLLTLLARIGFPTRWRDWIATLLFTSSTRIMLNGVPNRPIKHGRGLRQGDPLSPLLFVIAMDPLQKLLECATEDGHLSRLRGRTTQLRVSMYADDTAIFIKPTRADVLSLTRLLELFGNASGLTTNFQKSTILPIRCEGINLSEVLAGSPASVSSFPTKYLGLPLSDRRLKRVDFQPLVDKSVNKITLWNGRQINQAGRLTLVKAVLTAQAVYFLTALRAPNGVLNEIDRQRRKFLWAGTEALTGGKCKVNWPRSARPKNSGGLGILHIRKFARSLRLRWLWRQWAPSAGTSIGAKTPCNRTDKLLFAAATTLIVGDGNKALFWTSAWLHGQRPRDIAPNLYAISKRKNRTLRQALTSNTWIKDINLQHSNFTAAHLDEYTKLWRETRLVALSTGTPDTIVWKLGAKTEYSASSAYHAQFIGATYTNFPTIIWKPWAPPKCKFFSWLAIQNRIWTADRLQARNWPNQGTCTLCRAQAETGIHLFKECRFVRRIWKEIASWAQNERLHPEAWPPSDSLHSWWTNLANTKARNKRGLRSLIILVCWEIWKERNARVFERTEAPNFMVLQRIKDEATLWRSAGAKHLSALLLPS